MVSHEQRKFKYHKILSLDGSAIFKRMHPTNGIAPLTAWKNGVLDTARFEGVLDESLETDKLAEVYVKQKTEMRVPYLQNNCTRAVVSVSFDYAVKEFEQYGRRFVRYGYDLTDGDMTDHICVREIDGVPTLIAVEVPFARDNGYAPVEEPLDAGVLGKYFEYDSENRVYRRTEKEIPSAVKCEAIRAALYREGFEIDGIRYVRYKRSAGSSREGHCLFIAEPLYDDMMAWNSCGLSGDVDDQASWQAYISLTLSSIERIIKLPKKAILIIPDQTSVFRTHAVCVRQTEDGGLTADEEETEIENVIWDGEALMDVSVFEENGYSEHSMMLLRNRFFKTCAFNTNLQQWFADQNITQIRQLAGCTTARKVEDIKLVITESSLKYLKFLPKEMPLKEKFRLWLDALYEGKDTSDFGVVKTDHYPSTMDGNMAYTSYQLINTIPFTREGVEMFLEPSLDYLAKLQSESIFMRYHLKQLGLAEEIEADSLTAENYRRRLIHDMTMRSPHFEHTEIYKEFRTEICGHFKDRLKAGKVLVTGNYQTLCGNPYEFLNAVTDKHYKVTEPLAIKGDHVYTKRFMDKECVMCVRSPHITMGNLYMPNNEYSEVIERYFNLGENILCINAIGSNVQQRLNGCDYDSDTALVTLDYGLRITADHLYDTFGVPVCKVEPNGRAIYTNTAESLAVLDHRIAENRIGEIVNLSQFLNSLFWDAAHKEHQFEKLRPLYHEICILAVLSGMEIDKAKRLYDVNTSKVLSQLNRRKREFKEAHGGKVPEFFANMTEGNVREQSDSHAVLNTPMAFVYDIVNNCRNRSPYSSRVKLIDLFELDVSDCDSNDSHRKKNVIDAVKEAYKEIRRLKMMAKYKEENERMIILERADEVFRKCLARVSKYIVNDHVLHLLLPEIDGGRDSRYKVSGAKTFLFACLIYEKSGRLLSRIRDSENYCPEDLFYCHDAEESEDFPLIEYLYHFPYVRVCWECKDKNE